MESIWHWLATQDFSGDPTRPAQYVANPVKIIQRLITAGIPICWDKSHFFFYFFLTSFLSFSSLFVCHISYSLFPILTLFFSLFYFCSFSFPILYFIFIFPYLLLLFFFFPFFPFTFLLHICPSPNLIVSCLSLFFLSFIYYFCCFLFLFSFLILLLLFLRLILVCFFVELF